MRTVKVIRIDQSVELCAELPIEGEDTTRANFFFRVFLSENDFKYKLSVKWGKVYYKIFCDDLIDAAKVKTFLDTHNV